MIAALAIASGVSRSTKLSARQAFFRDPDAFAMLRTAVASGSAFLTAQMLDIKVFDALRESTWWKAPAASSLFVYVVDIAIFFAIAFASTGLPWAT